jgi:hypothetical protein
VRGVETVSIRRSRKPADRRPVRHRRDEVAPADRIDIELRAAWSSALDDMVISRPAPR